MRIPTVFAAACLILVSCQQEEDGCTDSSAYNFNPDAVEDDGSCDYGNDPSNYELVTIGEQVWFAENLRTTVYANGDEIPSVTTSDIDWASTDEGMTSIYGDAGYLCDDDGAVIDACNPSASLYHYGRLYNGFAVIDSRGLCPAGWHVPTIDDWTELEQYVSSYGFINSNDAPDSLQLHEALKESTPGTWDDARHGSNDFGFSALPGGRLFSGTFVLSGYNGVWWLTNGEEELGHFNIGYSGVLVAAPSEASSEYFKLGHSIRCIQD